MTTTPPTTSAPTSTSSKGTRILGGIAAFGVVWLVLLALVFSPDDIEQGDLVRILYVHVPSAWLAFMSFGLAAIGSAMVLWKRSQWWDLVAASSVEIGVMFCGLALLTGMIWGRPTWGTSWEWADARLVSTLVLFLTYVGYLAVRNIPADPSVRARRSAVVALAGAVNIPLVHFSVTWWRTLHQEATVLTTDFDPQIDDLMLFTLFFAVAVFTVVFAWLLMHRFRVAWLEEQIETSALSVALDERRAEAALVGGGPTP